MGGVQSLSSERLDNAVGLAVSAKGSDISQAPRTQGAREVDGGVIRISRHPDAGRVAAGASNFDHHLAQTCDPAQQHHITPKVSNASTVLIPF